MKVGRYQLFREIARGGMGTVHLGKLQSDFGVARLVAIKRLHAHIAKDAQFVRMFLDEARLCARIRHPNVVSLLDLVSSNDDLYMVLDYVDGETLGKLIEGSRKLGERLPDRVVSAIVTGALHGLHAAHEAKAEDGSALGIVHRDVSPQNILVGVDGIPRVVDFGVAKAAVRLQTTRDGELKGKLGYMAPEQVSGGEVTRRTDIFAAGVVLWELLTQRRLFTGDSEAQTLMKIVRGDVDPASDRVAGLDPAWDVLLERALALSASGRFATAREMAIAIEAKFPPASASELGEWVARIAEQGIEQRSQWITEVERAPTSGAALDAVPIEAPADTAIGPPVDTHVATAASHGSPVRKSSIGASLLIVAFASALTVGVVLLRPRAGASSEPGVTPQPSETVAATALASSAAGEASVPAPIVAVVESSRETVASPRSPAPGSAEVASTKPIAAHRPSKPAPTPSAQPAAASCRYFDAAEKIWKFRRDCYKQ